MSYTSRVLDCQRTKDKEPPLVQSRDFSWLDNTRDGSGEVLWCHQRVYRADIFSLRLPPQPWSKHWTSTDFLWFTWRRLFYPADPLPWAQFQIILSQGDLVPHNSMAYIPDNFLSVTV